MMERTTGITWHPVLSCALSDSMDSITTLGCHDHCSVLNVCNKHQLILENNLPSLKKAFG